MLGGWVKKLRQRGRRMMALCAVACWLLLNAQLALAAHQCDMSAIVPVTPTLNHHAAHAAHAAPLSAVAKAPLCDKHCTPDNAQKTASPLHLDAVAYDSGTRLTLADNARIAHDQVWLTPPRTGPPAEIVYCRFRE